MRFDDYLMRMVAQLTQAIARIVRRADSGERAEAREELAEAYTALLGNDRVFLDMVDTRTLARLVGSADKVRLLAKLSATEARIARLEAEPERARRLHERARELASIAHDEAPEDVDGALLAELETLAGERG